MTLQGLSLHLILFHQTGQPLNLLKFGFQIHSEPWASCCFGTRLLVLNFQDRRGRLALRRSLVVPFLSSWKSELLAQAASS